MPKGKVFSTSGEELEGKWGRDNNHHITMAQQITNNTDEFAFSRFPNLEESVQLGKNVS